jgi:hypothetical protein
MSALDRLRALEISEKGADQEPPKLTKGAFGGFVSTAGGTSPNIADVGEGAALAGPRYRWLILEPDGRRLEVCCLPEMSARELAQCYAGARVIPLSDAPDAAATLFGSL